MGQGWCGGDGGYGVGVKMKCTVEGCERHNQYCHLQNLFSYFREVIFLIFKKLVFLGKIFSNFFDQLENIFRTIPNIHEEVNIRNQFSVNFLHQVTCGISTITYATRLKIDKDIHAERAKRHFQIGLVLLSQNILLSSTLNISFTDSTVFMTLNLLEYHHNIHSESNDICTIIDSRNIFL